MNSWRNSRHNRDELLVRANARLKQVEEVSLHAAEHAINRMLITEALCIGKENS